MEIFFMLRFVNWKVRLRVNRDVVLMLSRESANTRGG